MHMGVREPTLDTVTRPRHCKESKAHGVQEMYKAAGQEAGIPEHTYEVSQQSNKRTVGLNTYYDIRRIGLQRNWQNTM